MWTSAARWSASCKKKGNSYGKFDRYPYHAITVEEYKDLLRAQTELAIIYQKSANGDAYNTGTFVQEMRNAFCNVRQENAYAE